MPGMMDTVLNLGLNDDTIHGLIKMTNNERFAWDSYRRFIQMFSNVVMGVEKEVFEHIITHEKERMGIKLDTEFTSGNLKGLVALFKARGREVAGRDFP